MQKGVNVSALFPSNGLTASSFSCRWGRVSGLVINLQFSNRPCTWEEADSQASLTLTGFIFFQIHAEKRCCCGVQVACEGRQGFPTGEGGCAPLTGAPCGLLCCGALLLGWGGLGLSAPGEGCRFGDPFKIPCVPVPGVQWQPRPGRRQQRCRREPRLERAVAPPFPARQPSAPRRPPSGSWGEAEDERPGDVVPR